MAKHILTIFIFLLSWVGAAGQPAESPKHEVRAVWLTTIGGLDWPHSYASSERSIAKQKAELRHLLDLYQRAGINTVLLQTRIRATTIYPSRYEPWDGCLSGHPGRSPGYDALQFAIDECHARGMELHAWVVTMPVGKWNATGCQQLRKKMPQLIRKIGPDGYMNPEDPRTASYLADICGEIVDHYDVDGIHLDYIRYPETWTLRVSRDQGRRNITAIVSAITNRVKQSKPWVKMSCSPIGKFTNLSRYWSHGWDAYNRVCQDAQGWLRAGLMDQLYPMMYFRGDQFFPFAIDWAQQSDGKMVAPGLGIYFLNPKEGNWRLADVTRELYVLRQYRLGQAYFRGKFLTDNEQGIYDFVARFNRTPALVPPMTWAGRGVPEAPSHVKVSPTGISWQGHTPYYNIYSSRTLPVDTGDPENLVATRRSSTSLNIDTEGRYFAITGMDRYGVESPATQSHTPSQPATVDVPLLRCDGQWLSLPPRDAASDDDLLIVQTLQGTTIATRTYQNQRLDVSRLPNGFYVLKSMGKRGKAHRLGFFKVERP